MKKIIYSIIGMMTLFASSCSDMLDVDSGREVELPNINQKSDSLFYTLGIMQAMQQAADAYVLQNEMRGDLATVTVHSDMNLRQLADFSATASNKYDSAYVYYRVINNCNYYLAKRDTTLYDGDYNVTTDEYAAVLSFRAWAYLQLVRNYGKVKFVTKPLVSLTDIENDRSEEVGVRELAARLVDEGTDALKRFSGSRVPFSNISLGVNSLSRCCIPIDIMIGELYLEAGRYDEAADYYTKYLLDNELVSTDQRSAVLMDNMEEMNLPNDYLPDTGGDWYQMNFYTWSSEKSFNGRISCITMAENRFKGVTTDLPKYFGYNYYSSSESVRERYMEEQQIVPSAAYKLLADSSLYYYTSRFVGKENEKGTLSLGDMRDDARMIIPAGARTDTMKYVDLYTMNGIVLFRASTVWLHLAEAFNRMGRPDAAFAILKDGITINLLSDTTYITDETKELLVTRYPFCTGKGASIFSGTGTERNYGIHRHGCGDKSGTDGVYSKYQLNTEVERKLRELDAKFDFDSTSPSADDSLKVLVNAVEDLLCDEYAMEFAFEGSRFSDLMRLARHKNESSPAIYGANFGGRWLQNKLAFKNPVKNLEDEQNWYLPFK